MLVSLLSELGQIGHRHNRYCSSVHQLIANCQIIRANGRSTNFLQQSRLPFCNRGFDLSKQGNIFRFLTELPGFASLRGVSVREVMQECEDGRSGQEKKKCIHQRRVIKSASLQTSDWPGTTSTKLSTPRMHCQHESTFPLRFGPWRGSLCQSGDTGATESEPVGETPRLALMRPNWHKALAHSYTLDSTAHCCR